MVNPYQILNSLLSEHGFVGKGFSIKFDESIKISIEKENDGFLLSFADNPPIVSVKKFLTISVQLKGIFFGPTYGTLRIRLFPDINFNYEDLEFSK